MSGKAASGRRYVTGSGTNSQGTGNSYTSYSTGGYSYKNVASPGAPAGTSYYTPSASSGSGFYTTAKGGASDGGYSFYQSPSGSCSYKY